MVAQKEKKAVQVTRKPLEHPPSFGVGSGELDSTGNKKPKNLDKDFIVGQAYWVPDRMKVWKKVTVLELTEIDGGDGNGGAGGGQKALCSPHDDPENLITLVIPKAEEGLIVPGLVPPSPVNPKVVDDITSLHFIHEAAILANLEARAQAAPDPKPYTYMCNVLVAVNPLRRDLVFLPSAAYKAASAAEVSSGLPPHPFGLAETVLRQLKQPPPLAKDQAIVISGESGAGKTESFKIVLNHLLTGGEQTGGGGGCRSEMRLLEQRLQESNPMMEALGNARTTRNHNSSRFGKFLKLVYHLPPALESSGGTEGSAELPYTLSGAKIETYLLEKTRVVCQGPGEGNFHVLYALLAAGRDVSPAAPPDAAAWGLRPPSAGASASSSPVAAAAAAVAAVAAVANGGFNYLAGAVTYLETPGSFEVPPRELFDLTTAGLLKVGVDPSEVAELWRVLAGLLHLGEVILELDPDSFEDGARVCGSDSKRSLHKAAELWGLKPPDLLALFTTRTLHTGNGNGTQDRPQRNRGFGGGGGSDQAVVKQLNPEQARRARDGIAKLVYTKAFEWVVGRTNEVLEGSGGGGGRRAAAGAARAADRSLGLLDLFGFEAFASNDLEQLLINLANEALQDMYCQQVLIAESLLYQAEGLQVANELDFVPNSGCVALLIQGFVPLLDEQTQTAQGSDKRLISELYRRHKQSPYLLLPHVKVRHESFKIRHYAEDVVYTVGNFKRKNDGSMPKDLDAMVATSSTCGLLRAMVRSDTQGGGGHGDQGGGSHGGHAATPMGNRAHRSAAVRTVAGEFARSIELLTTELGRSQCSYIRCVKPNAQMKCGLYDPRYVVTQLRCLGLLQTCEVLKVGLPTRVPYAVLRAALEAVLPTATVLHFRHRSDKELVMAALKVFDVPRDAYHLGYTRLFFGPGKYTELDRLLKRAAAADPAELARAMKAVKMRRLWVLLLCRCRVALMWIGELREQRARKARAMDLLKKKVHRIKAIKAWAALIIREGAEAERLRVRNKAASAIAIGLFRYCCRKSKPYRSRHRWGPRRQGEQCAPGEASAADRAAEEAMRLVEELTEEELERMHDDFKAQTARLRAVGDCRAAFLKYREEQVASMSVPDMHRRIKALGGGLKLLASKQRQRQNAQADAATAATAAATAAASPFASLFTGGGGGGLIGPGGGGGGGGVASGLESLAGSFRGAVRVDSSSSSDSNVTGGGGGGGVRGGGRPGHRRCGSGGSVGSVGSWDGGGGGGGGDDWAVGWAAAAEAEAVGSNKGLFKTFSVPSMQAPVSGAATAATAATAALAPLSAVSGSAASYSAFSPRRAPPPLLSPGAQPPSLEKRFSSPSLLLRHNTAARDFPATVGFYGFGASPAAAGAAGAGAAGGKPAASPAVSPSASPAGNPAARPPVRHHRQLHFVNRPSKYRVGEMSSYNLEEEGLSALAESSGSEEEDEEKEELVAVEEEYFEEELSRQKVNVATAGAARRRVSFPSQGPPETSAGGQKNVAAAAAAQGSAGHEASKRNGHLNGQRHNGVAGFSFGGAAQGGRAVAAAAAAAAASAGPKGTAAAAGFGGNPCTEEEEVEGTQRRVVPAPPSCAARGGGEGAPSLNTGPSRPSREPAKRAYSAAPKQPPTYRYQGVGALLRAKEAAAPPAARRAAAAAAAAAAGAAPPRAYSEAPKATPYRYAGYGTLRADAAAAGAAGVGAGAPPRQQTYLAAYTTATPAQQELRSGPVTPRQLADERMHDATFAAVQSLQEMAVQLQRLDPVHLIKEYHRARVAPTGRFTFSSQKSVRRTEAMAALTEKAEQDDKVLAVGRLLFDAEMVLHNLVDLERWHRAANQVNEHRNHHAPSHGAYSPFMDRRTAADVLGAHGKSRFLVDPRFGGGGAPAGRANALRANARRNANGGGDPPPPHLAAAAAAAAAPRAAFSAKGRTERRV